MRNYENIEFLLSEIELVDGEFFRNGRKMAVWKSGKGKYNAVGIKKQGKQYRAFVHNLLFAYHHGIDELRKHETIDHINGDKYDNRIENLQGLSRFENSQKDSNGKLSVEDARNIKILLTNGSSQKYIAELYSVSGATISKIKRGLRFKYVEI